MDAHDRGAAHHLRHLPDQMNPANAMIARCIDAVRINRCWRASSTAGRRGLSGVVWVAHRLFEQEMSFFDAREAE